MQVQVDKEEVVSKSATVVEKEKEKETPVVEKKEEEEKTGEAETGEGVNKGATNEEL